jgi:hypothetical protein
MDIDKETFLINEFLTMSLFGALGRSNTYTGSVSENDKSIFRNALREKLSAIGSRYDVTVTEETHLSNIMELADDLTLKFSHCLGGLGDALDMLKCDVSKMLTCPLITKACSESAIKRTSR